MDRADYWLYWHDNHARRLLQTIMGCVWPWTQIFLKSCWLNSKRYKVYSRSSSESTYCILFLNFLVLTSFLDFLNLLVWLSPSFWEDEIIRFTYCRFAWSIRPTRQLCLVPWSRIFCWKNAERQKTKRLAGGHLCACDGCMTQVMAAEQLVCTDQTHHVDRNAWNWHNWVKQLSNDNMMT